MQLKDMNALITGAGSGIGQAIAVAYAREGARLALVDLTRENLDTTVKLIGNQYPETEVLALSADVSRPEDAQRMVEEMVGFYGRMDILVNNAGITGSEKASIAHTTPFEEWEKVLAVNVTGVFLGSKHALPYMIQQGYGRIINIASAAGFIAFPRRCAYTTSKGAVVQLTKSLALDYASLGITVNAICPGMVETNMTRWRLEQPALRADIEREIPMGRVASVEQIAGAAVFLASEHAAYITGHNLIVDGGWTIH